MNSQRLCFAISSPNLFVFLYVMISMSTRYTLIVFTTKKKKRKDSPSPSDSLVTVLLKRLRRLACVFYFLLFSFSSSMEHIPVWVTGS